MTDELERLDGEIQRLRQEAAAVARMPPTIAERFAQTEAELRQAEQLYRTHGLAVSGTGHPTEAAHLKQQAVIGLCMTIGADKILKVERDRIAAAGEGIAAPDKTRRLADLEHAILQMAARRELLLRQREVPGKFLPRDVHPELVIMLQAAVERLAAR
jgi:hypothetical protein